MSAVVTERLIGPGDLIRWTDLLGEEQVGFLSSTDGEISYCVTAAGSAERVPSSKVEAR